MSAIGEIINSYTRKTTGRLGVGYKNLISGEEFYVDGDVRFPAASIFKVPVLIEFFNQLERGVVSMDTMVELVEKDISLGSGILNKLTLGIKLPLRDYVTLMMILSDNTAADYVVRLLGKDNINAMIASMGLKNTTLDYTCNELILANWGIPINTPRAEAKAKVESGDFTRNVAMYTEPNAPNNWTSPWDMTQIFSLLYSKKLVSEKACDEMMSIMEQCETNNRLPYLLPKNELDTAQKVIHKTGTLHRIVNDAGIIASKHQTYILAAFYNGLNASAEERDGNPGSSFGERLLAEMSRDVYEELHK